jgi:hypothetical protein
LIFSTIIKNAEKNYLCSEQETKRLRKTTFILKKLNFAQNIFFLSNEVAPGEKRAISRPDCEEEMGYVVPCRPQNSGLILYVVTL